MTKIIIAFIIMMMIIPITALITDAYKETHKVESVIVDIDALDHSVFLYSTPLGESVNSYVVVRQDGNIKEYIIPTIYIEGYKEGDNIILKK